MKINLLKKQMEELLCLERMTRSEVVHFFVTIRKILEILDPNKKTRKYRTIWFYTDWLLHTEKNRDLEYISDVLEDLLLGIVESGYSRRTPPSTDFSLMVKLKEELDTLFEKIALGEYKINQSKWPNVVSEIVAEIAEQPITGKGLVNILEIKIVPFRPGVLVVKIKPALEFTAKNDLRIDFYSYGYAYRDNEDLNMSDIWTINNY